MINVEKIVKIINDLGFNAPKFTNSLDCTGAIQLGTEASGAQLDLSNCVNLKDIKLDNFLFSFDENVDINELYVMSDLLITDYSSVFFDYAILNRPILFYMYDLEEYRDELRGFYLDINKELPGKITIDEDELLSVIKNENYKEYDEKLKEFRNTYNNLEDGKASQRVINNLILSQN